MITAEEARSLTEDARGLGKLIRDAALNGKTEFIISGIIDDHKADKLIKQGFKVHYRDKNLTTPGSNPQTIINW